MYAELRARLTARDPLTPTWAWWPSEQTVGVLDPADGAGDRRAPLGRGVRGARPRRRGTRSTTTSPPTASTSCSAGCAGPGTRSRRTPRPARPCSCRPATTRGPSRWTARRSRSRAAAPTAAFAARRAVRAAAARVGPSRRPRGRDPRRHGRAAAAAPSGSRWPRSDTPPRDTPPRDTPPGDSPSRELLTVPESWDDVRADLRVRLLDTATLVRAVAAGRRRGVPLEWRRAELRPVALKGGVRLQVTTYDERQARATNLEPDAAAGGRRRAARAGLRQLARRDRRPRCCRCASRRRATRRCTATSREVPVVAAPAQHDRVKPRLFDVGHADVRTFLAAVGCRGPRGPDQAEQAGQVPPGRGVRPAARRVGRGRAHGGCPARADSREPLAPGRSRLRARLPHDRRVRVAGEGARAAGTRARRRRPRGVARAQHEAGHVARAGATS